MSDNSNILIPVDLFLVFPPSLSFLLLWSHLLIRLMIFIEFWTLVIKNSGDNFSLLIMSFSSKKDVLWLLVGRIRG